MVERISEEEWRNEGKQLFGEDTRKWKFVCPSCNHVQSVQDYFDAGAPEGAISFSCVGRWTGAGGEKAFNKAGGPCNYTSGGLFNISPRMVKRTEDGMETPAFDFAVDSQAQEPK